MTLTKIPLREALEFARINGYLIATYKRADGYYVLESKSMLAFDLADDMMDVMVEKIGTSIDFKVFYSVDKHFCFKLHTYNLPEVIPIISDTIEKFVVIMDGGRGIPVFLTEDNGEACRFDTRNDATLMAENNMRARAVGYQVIPWHYEV